jgi:polyphenol oxidase
MYELSEDGVFRSSLLSRIPWLDHGFGSRHGVSWPGDYVRVRQVHSATVVPVFGLHDPNDLPEADAIITAQPDLPIGIRTADCVPVLIADPVLHCVAAVHAGWRGTAANIVAAAISKLSEEYGSRPRDLLAAIGPCIGRCCFEVGPEVAQQFELLFPEAPGLKTIDLAEANRRQMVSSGLPAEQIDIAGVCTRCDAVNFHSFRRDGDQSGRMVAAIRICTE